MTTDLERAGERYSETTAARNHAMCVLHAEIHKARGAGKSLRQIAKEAGVSYQRVHQLVTIDPPDQITS
jgi:lambda repressor-like predicted transcriptional regulator